MSKKGFSSEMGWGRWRESELFIDGEEEFRDRNAKENVHLSQLWKLGSCGF